MKADWIDLLIEDLSLDAHPSRTIGLTENQLDAVIATIIDRLPPLPDDDPSCDGGGAGYREDLHDLD